MTARSVPRHCQVSPWGSGPPPAENTGQERSSSPPPQPRVCLFSTCSSVTCFIRKGLAMQAPVSSLHLVLSLLCFERVPRNLYQMAIFVPLISLSQGILLRGCSYTLYFLLPDFPQGFRFPKFEGLNSSKTESKRKTLYNVSPPLGNELLISPGGRATGGRIHGDELYSHYTTHPSLNFPLIIQDDSIFIGFIFTCLLIFVFSVFI